MFFAFLGVFFAFFGGVFAFFGGDVAFFGVISRFWGYFRAMRPLFRAQREIFLELIFRNGAEQNGGLPPCHNNGQFFTCSYSWQGNGVGNYRVGNYLVITG